MRLTARGVRGLAGTLLCVCAVLFLCASLRGVYGDKNYVLDDITLEIEFLCASLRGVYGDRRRRVLGGGQTTCFYAPHCAGCTGT